MAFEKARFIIYYKNGNTKPEDRNDPHAWDNAPKYEYLCPECGATFPCFPEVTVSHCLKCGNEGRDVNVVRQTIISALGIQFDPMPLHEDGNAVLSTEGNPLRVELAPTILKGSSVYNYGFFQEKLGSIVTKGPQGKKQVTYGIRIGMVVNSIGNCFCIVGYIGRGQPSIYSYYTSIRSLGIDESALSLHSIKLSECGKRIVTKNGEPVKQQINLDLGERHEK